VIPNDTGTKVSALLASSNTGKHRLEAQAAIPLLKPQPEEPCQSELTPDPGKYTGPAAPASETVCESLGWTRVNPSTKRMMTVLASRFIRYPVT